MLDFTVIEKHDTSLDEWLWNNGFKDLSDKVTSIDGLASSELAETFEIAVEDYFGSEMLRGEIDSDDLYDICDTTQFDKLVSKTHKVTETLWGMSDDSGLLCNDLIEFLCSFDPFDPPFDDAEGKIDFYAEIVEQFLNDPNELVSQLKTMREDVDDDTEDAETIDDLIERLTELNKEEE